MGAGSQGVVVKLLFVTGSRADFSKLRPLIERAAPGHDVHVLVTGQHTDPHYGSTWHEVCGLRGIVSRVRCIPSSPHALVVSESVRVTCDLIGDMRGDPDAIVVHGDRAEALGGAIAGALSNIRVVHVEGGELSGTVDESMRHAVTKLAHLHLVANEQAARRLLAMGERAASIVISGSPEVDVMLSGDLPSLDEVRERYSLSMDTKGYGICIFHPVPTEEDSAEQARAVASAMLGSGHRFILLSPNNDPGSVGVFDALAATGFDLRPSMRHTHFITLLRHAKVVVGNSSCGVREAPVFGVPVVNVGTRQCGRVMSMNVTSVAPTYGDVLQAIERQWGRSFAPCFPYGRGGATDAFIDALARLPGLPVQKSWEGAA
jgi:UDP-N-acetylglucosamine 2-epimerase (hydrolysing)